MVSAVARAAVSMTPRKRKKPAFHKYRAIPTEVDGICFASRKEARVYRELLLRQRAGEVQLLELQPSFDIVVNGIKVCRYVADFRIREKVGKEWVERIVDAKGFQTPIYRLKKKLMLACHGLEIVEV